MARCGAMVGIGSGLARRAAIAAWIAVAASAEAQAPVRPPSVLRADPDVVYRALAPAAPRDGADCRFAAFDLAFVLTGAPVDAGVAGHAASTDGQTFELRSGGGGDVALVTPDGAATGLRVSAEADGTPRLRGTYRLRGLDCSAGVDTLLRAESKPVARPDLAAAYRAHARLPAVVDAQNAGDYAEALRRLEGVLRDVVGGLGADHPVSLSIEGRQPFLLMYLGQAVAAAEGTRALVARQTAAFGPMHPDTRLLRSDLASVLVQAGRYDEAIATGRELVEAMTAGLGAEHPETLRASSRLGIAYHFGDQLPAAREVLEKTVEAQVRVLGTDHRDLVPTRSVLAMNYASVGLLSEQLGVQRSAYESATRNLPADHPTLLRVKYNLAIAYEEAGDLAQALRIYEEVYAAQVAKFGTEHPDVARTLQALGSVFGRVGDPGAALAALDASVAISTRTLGERHAETAARINDRAGVLGALGRYDEAFAEQMRAYEIVRATRGDKDGETLRYLGNAGWAARLKGDFATARTLLLQAREAFEQIGDAEKLRAWQNERKLAELEAQAGPLEAAVARFGATAQAMTQMFGEGHVETLQVQLALAQARLRSGDDAGALALFEHLVALSEARRRDSGLTAEQLSALSRPLVEAYRSLTWLYAKARRDEDAFRLAELGRARRLLDELAQRRADDSGILAPAEQQELVALERRAAWLADAVGQAHDDPARRPALEIQRNAVQRELAQLRARLRAKYPRYAQMSNVTIVAARDFQRTLAADEAFVAFTVAHARLLAHVATARSLRTVDLGEFAPIAAQVRRLRDALADEAVGTAGGSAPGRALAARLARDLLAPLTELGRARRWILSPDADLVLLPFELLPWRSGRVVDAAELRYAQSASVHLLLAERQRAYRRQQSRLDVLAVGSPRYRAAAAEAALAPPDAPAGPAAASRRASATPYRIVQQADGRARGEERVGITWADLPASESEARGVARLFRRSRLLLHEDASETTLQKIDRSGELARYRYVLFATHGYLNLEVPLLSAVVLSQATRTPATDGYITAAEWPGYRLGSDLTVLSGCETALGPGVLGEGVMGLPFALFVAGNVNTVMTLWPVADRSTSEFMREFFARVQQGRPHAQALAETKRAMLRHPRYGAPRFWAPFVLYGH